MISLTLCRRILLALSVTGAALIAQSCKPRCTFYQNSGFIFGTQYHISYEHTQDIKKDIESHLELIDSRLSTFNPLSTISQINQGKSVALDSLTEHVIRLALSVSHNTNGAFDITVAPLVNAWGFGFKNEQLPDKHAVDSLMAMIGYKKVRYDGQRIVKSDKRITLDCSAIAKGYGVDVVAKLLASKGINNFLVEIGGEIVTRGISEKRLPWKIGVTKPTNDPLNEGQELQTTLNVTDKAMATSGNYRNFYYKGKKKYAHTIDPKTGYPVQHNILSATVLTDQCMRADAYATAFMVIGFDEALKVLERNPDLMAYLIYDDNGENKVWYSPSLKDKIAQ